MLGIKRGTTHRGGLVLTVSGTSANPFSIVPYGDAEALPIITGGEIVSTWTLVDATYNVWKYTMGATRYDVFQNDVRLWSLNPTDATENNATGVTLDGTDTDGDAVAALVIKGEGWSVYYSNVMYIRPYSGENPNGGQVEVNSATDGLRVECANIAASGYLSVVGMDVRKGRVHGLEVHAPSSYTDITTLADVSIVGCKVSNSGVDGAAGESNASVSVTGLSDAVRMTGLYVAGNFSTESINNAFEFEGISGATCEFNYGYKVGGYAIAELYASCDTFTLRYNKGELATNYGRRNTTFGAGGIWYGNNYGTAPGAWDTNDATNTKNFGHESYFNLIIAPQQRGFKADGGHSHTFHHNTVIIDGDAIYGDGLGTVEATGWYTIGTANTGFCDISNNLFYQPLQSVARATSLFMRIQTAVGATSCVPTGDKNVYFRETLSSGGFWATDAFAALADSKTSFTDYKTAMVTYGLDQNSYCGVTNAGNNLSSAQLGMDLTTFTPLAANIQGLTTLTDIGSRYQDGQGYDPAAPTCGALAGT